MPAGEKKPPDEREALYELTVQAHAAMKDLRLLIREAKNTAQELRDLIAAEFTEQINEAAVFAMGQMVNQISTHIDEATDAVFKRFDTIADMLLGETKTGRRSGRGITELIDATVEARERRKVEDVVTRYFDDKGR